MDDEKELELVPYFGGPLDGCEYRTTQGALYEGFNYPEHGGHYLLTTDRSRYIWQQCRRVERAS